MDYCYFDESGALGYSEKSPIYYSIAIMRTRNPKKISKHIKNIRKNIFKNKDKQKIELKFHDSDDRVRRYLLRKISIENIEIYALTLNKPRVYEWLQDRKDIWNRYLILQLLKKIPVRGNIMMLTIYKFLSDDNIPQFDEYLKTNLRDKIPLLRIKHENSRNDKCLQVVDFIVGAFFQKYNRKKEWYSKIIKEKTEIDEIYLPKKF